MIGGLSCAAIAAAVLLCLSQPSFGEDLQPTPVVSKQGDFVSIETSLRSRFGWTELAFRGDRPKEWEEMMSPEARLTLRVLNGWFEGKVEVGGLTDEFREFHSNNSYGLKAEVQLGVRIGDWSVQGEWRGRNNFNLETEDFVVGINSYGVRVKRRASEQLVSGLSSAQLQLSVATGYSAALPELFQRYFIESELEAVQALGGGLAVMIAPKIEYSDYVDFAGHDRKDAVFSFRIAPSYTWEDVVTISVEGQATTSYSTMDTKTGESWGITPILRLQRRL